MSKFRRLLASVAAIGMMLSIIPVASAGYFNDVSSDNVFAPFIDHGVATGYFSTSNSSFYPNNNLSRGELAKIAVVGAGFELEENTEHDFDDVKEGDTFYMYIETLLNNLVISPNQYYRAGDSVTRGEAAKILVNAFGYELDTTGGPTFSDVGADNVFYSYIETAVNNGLVNGYEDGTFKAGNNITRAEAAKILAMATGYTGEWGEADGLVLKLSDDSVAIGGSLTFTVKVVDENGSTVQDYDGDAKFSVTTGSLSDKNVELVNGTATVAYTAPGFGSVATVTAMVDDFEVEGMFTVLVPEDQRMMLYTTDSMVDPTETAVLYLTLADEAGMPINGHAADLTFDVIDGDGTVTNVAAFPGGADGVYRAIFNTNAAATGTNIIKVTDNETGDTIEMDLEVGVPNMDVYLIDPAISVNQSTTLLVNLTSGDGAPITAALDPNGDLSTADATLTAAFLNSELGNVTAAVVADEIGEGWYGFHVNADNRVSDDAKIKVSYTGVTPNVHEYVSLEVAPYDLSLEVINESLNTLNGVATLVLTVTDVNGVPVDVSSADFDATSDIDVDVITSAVWSDPSGNEEFSAVNDWFYATYNGNAGVDGVLVTQIYACGNPAAGAVNPVPCEVDDSSVTVRMRNTTAVNYSQEAEAVISFSDPIIDEAQKFATAGNDVITVSVVDQEGAAVLGLEDNGGGVNSYFYVNNMVVVPTANVVAVGGGLYVITDAGAANVSKLTLGNNDADFYTFGAANGNGDYAMVSDNSISEGITGNQARGGAIVVHVAGGVIAPFGAGVPDMTSDDASINFGGASTANMTLVAGTLGVYEMGVATAFNAQPTDELEIANLKVRDNNDVQLKSVTFSVRPVKAKHVSVDNNGKVVETIYGYLKAINNDFRLIDVMDLVNVDTDGSAEDAEARMTGVDGVLGNADDNIVQYTNGAAVEVAGLYGTRYVRGTNNDDANKEGKVEYQIETDDEAANVDNWIFDLVNPTYDVYVQNDTTYVAPQSDLTAAVLDADNAVFVLAVARGDQGVARDLSAGENMVIEVKSGDANVDTDAAGTAYDTGVDTINMVTPATFGGLYWANFLPGEDAEVSEVELYTTYDDNNDKYMFEIEVVWPTAQVVAFPLKIDPDKQNNESTIMAVVKDNYGNPIVGLGMANAGGPDIAVEIEGDQKLTTEYNSGDDSIYYGEYSTDEVGTQEVVVKYNDDYDVMTFDIVVEIADM